MLNGMVVDNICKLFPVLYPVYVAQAEVVFLFLDVTSKGQFHISTSASKSTFCYLYFSISLYSYLYKKFTSPHCLDKFEQTKV